MRDVAGQGRRRTKIEGAQHWELEGNCWTYLGRLNCPGSKHIERTKNSVLLRGGSGWKSLAEGGKERMTGSSLRENGNRSDAARDAEKTADCLVESQHPGRSYLPHCSLPSLLTSLPSTSAPVLPLCSSNLLLQEPVF